MGVDRSAGDVLVQFTLREFQEVASLDGLSDVNVGMSMSGAHIWVRFNLCICSLYVSCDSGGWGLALALPPHNSRWNIHKSACGTFTSQRLAGE